MTNQLDGCPQFFVSVSYSFFFLKLIVTCRLCVTYLEKDNDYNSMAQLLWVYTDYIYIYVCVCVYIYIYISWYLKNALKVINHSLTQPEQISKQAWCTNYDCNQETFSCTTFWTPLSLVFLRSCLLKMCVLCVMIKSKTWSTTWKHYAIITCNRRFWITITYGIYMPTLVTIKYQR